MKPFYDYLFVTHLPAFYKVNLYNEIAKHCRIFVIFIAKSSKIRAPDFTSKKFLFDYTILNQEHLENRPLFQSINNLIKIKSEIKFRKLIVGGWDCPEFWYLVWTSSKMKNCLALESSIYESRTSGIKKLIKKIFLSRISQVFSSGEPQVALLKAMHFNRKITKTLGVGVFNQIGRIKREKSFAGKFLFVGRLAREKNLGSLLQVFSQFPEYSLTIIGHGPLQNELIAKCPRNVKIIGHVPNEVLAKWYQQHDIFILPSFSEPWGLVVEEALFYGLPVIVSDRVGCAQDLVLQNEVGLVFDPFNLVAMKEAISYAHVIFEVLSKNVEKLDFKKRDAHQVQQYLESVT